jgi:hypothetical protein
MLKGKRDNIASLAVAKAVTIWPDCRSAAGR